MFTISNPIGSSKAPSFLHRWNTQSFTTEDKVARYSYNSFDILPPPKKKLRSSPHMKNPAHAPELYQLLIFWVFPPMSHHIFRDVMHWWLIGTAPGFRCGGSGYEYGISLVKFPELDRVIVHCVQYTLPNVVDPDLNWIRIQECCCIRVCNPNTDPDPCR